MKQVLVIEASPIFTEGPWRPRDFVEPYLRQVLGFIGIVDVQTVRVEGMNLPQLAAAAVPKANKAFKELAVYAVFARGRPAIPSRRTKPKDTKPKDMQCSHVKMRGRGTLGPAKLAVAFWAGREPKPVGKLDSTGQ